MARFYGQLKGRAPRTVTRTGTNFMESTVTGWWKGITVRASVEDGIDTFTVYIYPGSARKGEELIPVLKVNEAGEVRFLYRSRDTE